MHAKVNTARGLVYRGRRGKMGTFIVAGRTWEFHQVVYVTIGNTLACGIKAKVVRVTNKGMELEFEKPPQGAIHVCDGGNPPCGVVHHQPRRLHAP